MKAIQPARGVRSIAALTIFPTMVMTIVMTMVLMTTTAWAKQPETAGDLWIVELEDAPTVQFRGGQAQSVTATGARSLKAFEPTAPEVTGARRLNPQSDAVVRYADFLDDKREAVLSRARAELAVEIEPKFVYRHLFNGFAAPMTAGQAARLAALPGVRSVTPDAMQTVHTDAGPTWIGAPSLWDGSTGAPNPTRGEGTVLGVIDTGINWESVFFDLGSPGAPPVTNPRGRFFGLCDDPDVMCSDKLIGVYDFTDEGTKGFDPDGHGSHVASTAVGLPLSFTLDFGTGSPIGFSTSGVAPRASFISYKACEAPDPDSGPSNFQCLLSTTGAALEQALVDQVDAINFSIGGPAQNPWGFGSNQDTFLNLRAAGIVPVVSAGNDGPLDGTVGNPASLPWVLAVANASHGRVLGNSLVDTSGGAFPLGDLVGQGLTSGTTSRPIVHARDFGSALCGFGPAELGPNCNDNTGASNPFPPGTFNGEIVVCDRGTYGRVEKGRNVFEAGAGGMILANTEQDGEATVSDQHCLPATHVGQTAGDRLRLWLAGGSNHQGRLSGADRFIDPAQQGLLNPSSSRGPNQVAVNVMKPNVTGPGTGILAASTDFDQQSSGPGADAANQISFLTGTSMSSPHVAGAALLLRSANPGWGPDEIISALETTAAAANVKAADGSTSRIVDRGAGGVQVDRAARAGLYLPTTTTSFQAANPALGGIPGDLNLPGIIGEDCDGACTFTRTVRALGPGTWSVTTEGDLDTTVSPTQFTLAAGGEQTLQITLRRGSARLNRWNSGAIVLLSSNPAFVSQRLPVGAFFTGAGLPDPLTLDVDANRGRIDLDLPDLVETGELVIRTSALVRPQRFTPRLVRDPTRNDALDDLTGTRRVFFDVPENVLMVHAETFTSTSLDVDLFMGRDLNNDGLPQFDELRCSSQSPDDLERCQITEPEAGGWWVVAQNWNASIEGSDVVPFEIAVLVDDDDASLVSFGPGLHPGGPISLPVYWDQPAMLRNERWIGAVGIASSPDALADAGAVSVALTRRAIEIPRATALFENQPMPVVVAGGGTVHRKLFIDVPPTATRLTVDVEGDIDRATLRLRAFSSLAASVPDTPPAPATVLADFPPTPTGRRVVFSAPPGGRLTNGRYYVVLENDQPQESLVTITATVEELGSVPTQRGLWGPEARSINQGFDWEVGGDNSFLLWYTYDEQGLPTFYISAALPEDPQSSYFSAPLFRVTSNGERQTPVVVGEVQATRIAAGRMMVAWRLNGNRGAEMFNPNHGSSCPTINGQPTSLLGHWISPDSFTGGLTWLITASSEAAVRYYYDRTNQPRWVIADTELPATLPNANRMEVLDLRGWCAYCEPVPLEVDVVGTLERQFLDQVNVRDVTDFVAGAGIDTSVTNDRQLLRLSNVFDCSNAGSQN